MFEGSVQAAASGACDNPEIDKLIVHELRIVDNKIQVALSRETRPPSPCHAGGCTGCGRA